jgi:hypothetical protein
MQAERQKNSKQQTGNKKEEHITDDKNRRCKNIIKDAKKQKNKRDAMKHNGTDKDGELRKKSRERRSRHCRRPYTGRHLAQVPSITTTDRHSDTVPVTADRPPVTHIK